MSTEINTRGAIRSKVLGFPAGNDNECFSKLEILATGKALVNGNYGDNECPAIEDVEQSLVYPIDTSITMKRNIETSIRLSGYVGLIVIDSMLINGIPLQVNLTVKAGDIPDSTKTFSVSVRHYGNSISFTAVGATPAALFVFHIQIQGISYSIQVKVIN